MKHRKREREEELNRNAPPNKKVCVFWACLLILTRPPQILPWCLLADGRWGIGHPLLLVLLVLDSIVMLQLLKSVEAMLQNNRLPLMCGFRKYTRGGKLTLQSCHFTPLSLYSAVPLHRCPSTALSLYTAVPLHRRPSTPPSLYSAVPLQRCHSTALSLYSAVTLQRCHSTPLHSTLSLYTVVIRRRHPLPPLPLRAADLKDRHPCIARLEELQTDEIPCIELEGGQLRTRVQVVLCNARAMAVAAVETQIHPRAQAHAPAQAHGYADLHAPPLRRRVQRNAQQHIPTT